MKKKVAVIFFIILSMISLCFNAYATDGTETVYVTKTGSKYHTYGCDYLNGQPLKTTLSNAIDKGYSPCKMCNPYGLADTQSSASNSDENNNYFMYMTIVLYLFRGVRRVPLVKHCHIFLWTVRAYKNTWMMWIYRCFLALKLILYTDYLFMQKYFSDVLLDRKTLQRLY